MTPDRHLGSAWIDKCRPDLLISESTYATTIRDSKRCRERDFLKKVHDTIDKGGKVSYQDAICGGHRPAQVQRQLVLAKRPIVTSKLSVT
jgi:predicted metal-dependent RNase